MLPRSSSLFHFTKSLDILQAILKDGFWPRYCLEDIQWQGHVENEFVSFPMVCFCDIPIGRISEHVNFYGSFGIGLTKEWGAKNNLNPIMYFAGNNPVHGALQAITGIVTKLPDKAEHKAGLKNIRYILGHTKPTSGRMILSGEPVRKDFYQESEWRFVPQHTDISDYLSLEQFQKSDYLNECNKKTSELCRLKFLPTDVKYIFVPSDADIPAIMNFLQSELDHYPNADLKVLMARVTSLESMSVDL
ncbi:hypothetical protein D3C72_106260 [compost metagenome]